MSSILQAKGRARKNCKTHYNRGEVDQVFACVRNMDILAYLDICIHANFKSCKIAYLDIQIHFPILAYLQICIFTYVHAFTDLSGQILNKQTNVG